MDIDDILAEVDRAGVPQEARDLQSLTRLWVAERVAPEMQPYPEDLMERVLDRIAKQIEAIEEEAGNMDPKTSFKLVVVQTELERFKFLVRSFLRARIAKLDAHPHYYSSGTPYTFLSASERQYLSAHQALLARHYAASFLSQFPHSLQRLDDSAGGVNMVDVPDVDKAVICRVLKDNVGVVAVEGTDVRCDMERGDVWVIRWSAIKERVMAGDLELI
ncbi:GINS complex, Sld5 component [Trichodelitschia bisporula]|uniref:DNA replication complex GINS protein SLD5 n=1 Tax=Trichodelitschia bisporula TaxID=703511 RepID=A0A6G1I1Z3_9PEZI|nr:GINS complex, Sld5 component [Trichodelitschia bisporula]